jgi:hypothetical protein
MGPFLIVLTSRLAEVANPCDQAILRTEKKRRAIQKKM